LVDTQLGTGSQARPPVRDARSRLRLYLARLSKTYLSVRPGPVSVTAEVLRPDASRARSGHQEHRPPSTLGVRVSCRYILARCFSLHALASPSRRLPRGSAHVTSAPGAFGPTRDHGDGHARSCARLPRYVGLRAPINNTNDARAARTINLSRPHFTHDGHESE
jgi:hypothetical protein